MKEQNHVFHHRMFYCLHWAIPEKIETGRLRIWNFHGYQRNSMSSFQGLTKNELEYPRVTKEKIMWNFQVSLFLVLEFPRDLTQFCGIAKGGALLCLELPGVTAVMAGNDTFQQKKHHTIQKNILTQPKHLWFALLWKDMEVPFEVKLEEKPCRKESFDGKWHGGPLTAKWSLSMTKPNC